MRSIDIDPLRLVARKSTSGHDDMHVDVKIHLLSPGMQNQNHAWFTVKLLLADSAQQLSRSAAQNLVHQLVVDIDQRVECMRQREDDVKIIAVKSPVDHTFAPLFPSLVSASWTVAVSAVIQTNQPPVATLAVVKMAAHVASATRGESIHDRADVCKSFVVVTLLVELRVPTVLPQDVIDFEAVGFRLS